jgi:hypothetical protein
MVMRRRTLFTTALNAGAAALLPARAGIAAAPATQFGVISSTMGRKKVPGERYNDAFKRLYREQRDRFGGGPIGIRLFSGDKLPQPGNGTLLTWAAAPEHADERITVSHKTRDEPGLTNLLDWAHDNHVRLSVIYFHEVQDDYFGNPDKRDERAEPEAYLAAYQQYRRMIDAHPARPLVTLEKNLMWFWQHYNAKKHGGDWSVYIEDDDPADLISWDTYVFPGMPTAQGRYATADEFFRYPLAVWRRTGKPWAVGEIGTTVQDGSGPGAERDWDRGGTKFATWVRAITAAASHPATIGAGYAGLPPARFVKWWEAGDQHNRDQSLEQVPAAVAAYRELVKSAPLT